MIRSPLADHFVLSPNVGTRRNEVSPDMLILHYTGMESAARACDWLCNPASHVSCHYLVDESGHITQMVGEELRAWHAGVSSWRGDRDINSRSIGIEIHNLGPGPGYGDFPEAQMRAVIALCHDIGSRNDIAPRYVLGHSDIAPQRKVDPGEKFDWRRLHEGGIGHWVVPVPATPGQMLRMGDQDESVKTLQLRLADYGYDVAITGVYDKPTQTVVAAFQRHFRPARIDGVADVSTVATLENLLSTAT